MATTEQQRRYTATWVAKMKREGRWEAHMEKTRAYDRARPYRRPLNPKARRWSLQRLKSVMVEKDTSSGGPAGNRPHTITDSMKRERYDLTRQGERVTAERVKKLQQRRRNTVANPASNRPYTHDLPHLLGASAAKRSASKSPST